MNQLLLQSIVSALQHKWAESRDVSSPSLFPLLLPRNKSQTKSRHTRISHSRNLRDSRSPRLVGTAITISRPHDPRILALYLPLGSGQQFLLTSSKSLWTKRPACCEALITETMLFSDDERIMMPDTDLRALDPLCEREKNGGKEDKACCQLDFHSKCPAIVFAFKITHFPHPNIQINVNQVRETDVCLISHRT